MNNNDGLRILLGIIGIGLILYTLIIELIHALYQGHGYTRVVALFLIGIILIWSGRKGFFRKEEPLQQ